MFLTVQRWDNFFSPPPQIGGETETKPTENEKNIITPNKHDDGDDDDDVHF